MELHQEGVTWRNCCECLGLVNGGEVCCNAAMRSAKVLYRERRIAFRIWCRVQAVSDVFYSFCVFVLDRT